MKQLTIFDLLPAPEVISYHPDNRDSWPDENEKTVIDRHYAFMNERELVGL
jgi:hypothetical protein